jgi:hypothetical protein
MSTRDWCFFCLAKMYADPSEAVVAAELKAREIFGELFEDDAGET